MNIGDIVKFKIPAGWYNTGIIRDINEDSYLVEVYEIGSNPLKYASYDGRGSYFFTRVPLCDCKPVNSSECIKQYLEKTNTVLLTKEYYEYLKKLESVPIPYLMHKKMDIPISECQKAYDVAIDYLRSKATMKG